MAIGIRPDGVPTSATQCQRALACFAIGEDIDRLRHGHGQPRAASITSMKVQGRAVGCRQGALPVGMATRRIRGVAPPGIVGRRALAHWRSRPSVQRGCSECGLGLGHELCSDVIT